MNHHDKCVVRLFPFYDILFSGRVLKIDSSVESSGCIVVVWVCLQEVFFKCFGVVAIFGFSEVEKCARSRRDHNQQEKKAAD